MQDGRCKTLDAGADGYMRGEACVVHLIEAFEAAELAACHLSNGALILHGTAVNQDGRSSSLTVQTTVSSGRFFEHAILGDGPPVLGYVSMRVLHVANLAVSHTFPSHLRQMRCLTEDKMDAGTILGMCWSPS